MWRAFVHVTKVVRGLRGEIRMLGKGERTGRRIVSHSTESKVDDESTGIQLQGHQVYLGVTNLGGLGYAYDPSQHLGIEVGRNGAPRAMLRVAWVIMPNQHSKRSIPGLVGIPLLSARLAD